MNECEEIFSHYLFKNFNVERDFPKFLSFLVTNIMFSLYNISLLHTLAFKPQTPKARVNHVTYRSTHNGR